MTWQQQSFYPGQADVLPNQHQDSGTPTASSDAADTRTAGHRAVQSDRSSFAPWGIAVVAVVCAMASLVAGSKPVSVVLLLLLVALNVPAVRGVVRGAAPNRPAPPMPESVQPVVIGAPPAARVPALANSCFWCSRPLTDFESRQLGADPNCVKRRGPHQVHTVNPHYIAWGNALHALRMQQHSERPAVAVRNEAAAAAHAEALATWEATRQTPAGNAAQSSRRRALLVAAVTVLSTLVAAAGLG